MANGFAMYGFRDECQKCDVRRANVLRQHARYAELPELHNQAV